MWCAQHEQGYVLDDGREVVFYSQPDPSFTYHSPDEAATAWTAAHTDAAQLWKPYANGHEHRVDVRFNKEYTDLHIVELIEDRIYFLPVPGITPESETVADDEDSLAVAS